MSTHRSKSEKLITESCPQGVGLNEKGEPEKASL